MIGNTIKGMRFKGVFAYLLSVEKVREEGARIIGGTVRHGSIDKLAEEFEGVRLLAPGRKHVVYHQMLRSPPGEGEALSDATWLEIAADHARVMGYAKGQWMAVRHHDHIHIVANRVLLTGKVVSDSFDYARAERSVRAIEKKFGLTQVASSHLLEPEKAREHERAPSQAEMARAARGDFSVRELIQERLLAVLDRPQSFTDFADRLYERRVLVRPNLQSTDRVAGLSFMLTDRPDLAFSGSRLGRAFSFGKLREQGLHYDPKLDREGVARCLARCRDAENSRGEAGKPPAEPLRPLVDPAETRRHLEHIGTPLILAAKDRDGETTELGEVDARSIGRWKRRLRRRSAQGQEILVRPKEDSPILLLPNSTQPQRSTLAKLGIAPFLSLNTMRDRRDLWIRTSRGAQAARRLLAGVRWIVGGGKPAWGRLAGYRPDPISHGSSTAYEIKNRVVAISHAVVDVSLELLQRLRQTELRLKKPRAPTQEAAKPDGTHTDRGRSR